MKLIQSAKKKESIRLAADLLRQGKLVVFPTETVYGLGADALNEAAVCHIFEAKKRPSFDPLIVHAFSAKQAFALAKNVPPAAKVLAKQFWPGPLTLVLPKKRIVPDVVTSGLETVALRVPAHPVARKLLREFGGPIAAPSANLFGRTSPTTAKHVQEDLGGSVSLILDGGRSAVGVESTVLKIENGAGVILRPGAVTAEDVSRWLPARRARERGSMESPGQMLSHYAPKTAMWMLAESGEKAISSISAAKAKSTGLITFSKKPVSGAFASVAVLSRRGNLEEAAAELFHAIRKLDKMGFRRLIAEPVPDTGIGIAINDRLRKAAGGKILH